MGFVGKVYKSWQPAKLHRKVKIARFCRILKPSKMFKFFKPLLRKLLPQAMPLQQPQQAPRDDELAFLACIIEVDPSRRGWQRAVSKVLANIKGVRFKMDQSGRVQVSGIGDPNKLLKKLGRSRKVKVNLFQFGQCCSNLYMPEPEKKKPDVVAQEKTNDDKKQHYEPHPPYSMIPPPYTRYGYQYEPPLLPPQPPPPQVLAYPYYAPPY